MSRVRPPSKQRIRQAAEAVIRMHGTDALAEAAEHVHLHQKKTIQPKHREIIKEVA
jgi:hypothetical protein